jgi:hypothetical protein
MNEQTSLLISKVYLWLSLVIGIWLLTTGTATSLLGTLFMLWIIYAKTGWKMLGMVITSFWILFTLITIVGGGNIFYYVDLAGYCVILYYLVKYRV